MPSVCGESSLRRTSRVASRIMLMWRGKLVDLVAILRIGDLGDRRVAVA
jgi:hypothetical protein